MPPQPLHLVRRNAVVLVGGDAAHFKPELAAIVARVIGHWADVEAELGAMLVALLRSNPAPAVAMFNELRGVNAQILATTAVAETVLADDPESLDLFHVVVEYAMTVKSHRDKFARWSMAFAPDLEDALLFVDPRAVIDNYMKARVSAAGQGHVQLSDLDLSRVLVYRKCDLDEVALSALAAATFMGRLRLLLHLRSGGAVSEVLDRAYDSLTSVPVLATALAKLRSRRQSGEATPPSRRGRRPKRG